MEIKKTLMPFENLEEKFKISEAYLFKYFQIGSFIHSRIQSYQCTPLSITVELENIPKRKNLYIVRGSAGRYYRAGNGLLSGTNYIY